MIKPNIVTIVAAALIVLAGAYWYFSTSSGNEAPLSVTTDQSESQAQFQALVISLQPISFSSDIFANPRFMALVDLATPIAPESAGRADPFAPLSAGAGTPPTGKTATSSASAATKK